MSEDEKSTDFNNFLYITSEETCLGGSGDWDIARTDRDGLSEELRFNSPGRPVGFQGRILWD